ncbi:hypothetical protein A3F66_02845 [candidate division TM6 bacterium RIFCSPHIGHO2_12_FULL_32_22]|nr:MAG: hypothetical protein A3F66_02845 [candidate division TM6 bacterium RIFCSPHIGHO2_12_FULL_32_22]
MTSIKFLLLNFLIFNLSSQETEQKSNFPALRILALKAINAEIQKNVASDLFQQTLLNAPPDLIEELLENLDFVKQRSLIDHENLSNIIISADGKRVAAIEYHPYDIFGSHPKHLIIEEDGKVKSIDGRFLCFVADKLINIIVAILKDYTLSFQPVSLMIFDKNGNVIKQIFDNYFRPKISDDGSIIAAAKSTPLNNIDIDIFDRGGMLLKTIAVEANCFLTNIILNHDGSIIAKKQESRDSHKNFTDLVDIKTGKSTHNNMKLFNFNERRYIYTLDNIALLIFSEGKLFKHIMITDIGHTNIASDAALNKLIYIKDNRYKIHILDSDITVDTNIEAKQLGDENYVIMQDRGDFAIISTKYACNPVEKFLIDTRNGKVIKKIDNNLRTTTADFSHMLSKNGQTFTIYASPLYNAIQKIISQNNVTDLKYLLSLIEDHTPQFRRHLGELRLNEVQDTIRQKLEEQI